MKGQRKSEKKDGEKRKGNEVQCKKEKRRGKNRKRGKE